MRQTKEEKHIAEAINKIPVDRRFKAELATEIDEKLQAVVNSKSSRKRLRVWISGLVAYSGLLTLVLCVLVVGWIRGGYLELRDATVTEDEISAKAEEKDLSGLPQAFSDVTEPSIGGDSGDAADRPGGFRDYAPMVAESLDEMVHYERVSDDLFLYWGKVASLYEIGVVAEVGDYESRQVIKSWTLESFQTMDGRLIFFDGKKGFGGRGLSPT